MQWNSLLIGVFSFVGYLLAYHTYGKFLARKIFGIDPSRPVPSHIFNDDHDYVPSSKEVVFGHHFTSIAGLGPILGPAIGIIWGWVPALLWVVLGSIFMGAVHDFGALVVSLRHEGKSIGEIASKLVSPRVKYLFLSIIFFELWIVIAIFALIIAILFQMYPQAVFPIWMEVPIALWLGYMVHRKGKNIVGLSIVALVLLYITIFMGAYLLPPLKMPKVGFLTGVEVWMLILFAYCYIASTLPVWKLLQPRDFINSHELIVLLFLLFLGLVFSHPPIVAPAFNLHPQGAPPIWPFLFVVIACGAISGFHSLVSSGVSSKQLDSESHAQFVGYGGMLLEGALAVLVLTAVMGGIGMGIKGGIYGTEAWKTFYSSWQAAKGLNSKISAFVTGAVNMLSVLHIPPQLSATIFGVFLVSFAATTLDSATRIQRYVISELSSGTKLQFLTRRHPATLVAVFTALALAFAQKGGKGALILWPLFGTVNQLLAGLALLIITVYLFRKKVPPYISFIPFLFMVVMTGWALILNLKNFFKSAWHLFIIGLLIFFLEIWMIAESIPAIRREGKEKS
ncbi:carbon starvation protein A [Candidatus Calescamantes bacterium]|nr:carbon starvation protein A [Candidatus Calescamantes bacterium]